MPKEHIDKENPLFAYFGHHKAASSWISQILKDVCCRLNYNYVSAYKPESFGYDLPKYVAVNNVQFLAYKTANYQYVLQLRNFKGFHVIRDPRDLVVSGYFSHLYSHPVDQHYRLAKHRKQLQTVSLDEGLQLEMQFSTTLIEDMASWDYSIDAATAQNILQYKMEDLTQHPYKHLLAIFRFMDLLVESPADKVQLFFIRAIRRTSQIISHPVKLSNRKISKKDLSTILEQHSFEKMTGGRMPGQEDQKSHYRKGQPGDWVNYFKPQHIEYFVEYYNPVLLKLGYETDPNWAENYL